MFFRARTNSPFGRRVEAMVIARREINDAVVERVAAVSEQTFGVGVRVLLFAGVRID